MMAFSRCVASTAIVSILMVVSGWSGAAAAGLPDGRAYELVSPPAKRGADVMADSGRTRAAVDGSAASFSSLGGFGDVRGFGVATEYLSERSPLASPGSNGWSTHAITPAQDPQTFTAAANGQDPLWVGPFSPDLAKGVFRSYSTVTDEDSNVLNVRNLYVRDDLRSAGSGHYRLLTGCPACTIPLSPPSIFQLVSRKPVLVGASADFSHVLFTSTLRLTADVSGGTRTVFEWVDGAERRADVLPDDACGLPPCLAAGSSAGGDRPMSSDGSRIIFRDQSTGKVWERIGGVQSVAVSASERTDCADHDPCSGTLEPDPAGSQSATVATSSTDGTRVFFTSSERLTDDDDNSAIDLYMWDANAPSGRHLARISVDDNSVDGPGSVVGVFGASADGHYAYFVAAGQLVAGQPDLGGVARGIYVWHDGVVPAVDYVGEMADPSADTFVNLLPGPPFGAGIRSHVTPDGTHLLFMSHSGEGLLSAHGGTDADETRCSGCSQFYLYSAPSNKLVCVSCVPGGAPNTASAEDVVREATGASSDASVTNHPLSDDGRFVFFQTAEALVPEDANGKSDVYEYDAQTGAAHLISSGRDPADSYFLDADSSGRNAFFLTRQRLVGWDTDPNYDLYDARVDGGFPEPPVPVPPCATDACRGPFAIPPLQDQAASSIFHGVGNVKAALTKPKPKPKKCKKGYTRRKVRGKVRCVKHKRTIKHGKAASTHRSTR